MPKRTDIKKIMIIGSGPIVIGQAAEFDYAGTQSCLALKEEGYEVVLLNSNPATIMTDTEIADKVYMEPLTLSFVAQIVRKERPDAIIPSLGGQTGLNLVIELSKSGVLDECGVEVLGTNLNSIYQAEDRELFRSLCQKIGEPTIVSEIAESVEALCQHAETIGYPVVLRPAFTLGGTGGGFANNQEELLALAENALQLSPVGQVLVEKSVKGYKEVEYEVIRDKNDTAIIVCNMENIDPVGIHTGDSAVVAPSLTLTNKEYQMLRNASLNLIRNLGIEGGCNVQFALDSKSKQYYVIEVNPRVSRSSALASKATGYPIAFVSTKIAVGYTLDEIQLKNTPACFEPTLDYIVTKLARFPFDKFPKATRLLSTQMKATGEVMAIGRSFEESFLKALRSLENDYCYLEGMEKLALDEVWNLSVNADDRRLYAVAELLRRNVDESEIVSQTKIDAFFIAKLANIIQTEKKIANEPLTVDNLTTYKAMGFSDQVIAKLRKCDEKEIEQMRTSENIYPSYQMIDSCASEFSAYIPYFYSTYSNHNESVKSDKEKIIVIGSGPIRIGQGIEFDYSTVHAIKAIQKAGFEAIVINCNPETVSTDYTLSDKLYFEPLTIEDVMNIVRFEKPKGVVVQLGGQTAINLADGLSDRGVRILGTSADSISVCEDRERFEALLEGLKIARPKATTVERFEEGLEAIKKIGYPALIRPSFVLGGRSMKIIQNDQDLTNYLASAINLDQTKAVLIDQYIEGKEIELDAVCDGENVFIPGILEHVEKTGVHSGDSMSVYPSFSLSQQIKDEVIEIACKIGRGLNIRGLFNIQFIVTRDQKIYIIEVNPRASRSVPFISKVTNHNISRYATEVMLGKNLIELGLEQTYAEEPTNQFYVKAPTFSFSKIDGLDTYLSPEMKSTGEAIGYDTSVNKALYKAFVAAGVKLYDYGTVLFTIEDQYKEEALIHAKRFYELGFNLVATKKTAAFLKQNGLKVKTLKKMNEESSEIIEWIQKGYIRYIVNISNNDSEAIKSDGYQIRTAAAKVNIVTFTSLDTLNAVLNVLEERVVRVNSIN